MKKNVVIVVASTVKNLELARKFEEKLSSLDAEVTVINLVELDLPLYTSVSDTKFSAIELLKDHLPVLEKSKGLVFIAPEYNGSTPPVLPNFLAWLSRSSKEWRNHLNGKHAAIATYSAGTGLHVLAAMRAQLAFIGMNVLGRQIVTSGQKALDENSLLAVCSELLKYS